MSRTPSAPARAAMFGQSTDEVFLLLLTISHADFSEDIRLVNNYSNITSRGLLWVGYPFEIDLPGESADSIERVTLKIDNVDRSLVETIRGITGRMDIDLEVIMASSPDIVEAGPFAMSLVSVEYDALTIQGELAFEDLLNEPYPGDSYIPADYPGLF